MGGGKTGSAAGGVPWNPERERVGSGKTGSAASGVPWNPERERVGGGKTGSAAGGVPGTMAVSDGHAHVRSMTLAPPPPLCDDSPRYGRADRQTSGRRERTGTPAYCRARNCGYNLRGLPASTTRCPECGHPFDPADPKTYRSRPLRPWLRHVKRATLALAALLLILAATWGWFYWGWYDEQQALAKLKPVSHTEEPILPWLRQHGGAPAFVLDRVDSLDLNAQTDPSDLGALAALAHLRALDLSDTPMTDLRPLASLRSLRRLILWHTPTTDVAPLAALPKLEYLVCFTGRLQDVVPLMRLQSLRHLYISKIAVPRAQAIALRDALPNCNVNWADVR